MKLKWQNAWFALRDGASFQRNCTVLVRQCYSSANHKGSPNSTIWDEEIVSLAWERDCYLCSIWDISNTHPQPNVWQQFIVDTVNTKFKPSIRVRNRGDLSGFELGMVLNAKRSCITADLLWFFPCNHFYNLENYLKKRKSPFAVCALWKMWKMATLL